MNATRILAEIKLRETRRQRDRLHELYDAIETQLAQETDPLGKLRILQSGLSQIIFARRPLHPNSVEIDALLLVEKLGSAPPELIADRIRMLEKELAQGRLRAEFTLTFGSILNEWKNLDPTPEVVPEEDPLAVLWSSHPEPDMELLEEITTGLSPAFQSIRTNITSFCIGSADTPITQAEVVHGLARLSHESYRRYDLRREAGTLRNHPTLPNEFAGVLTILLNNLDTWDWPEEGFPLRALWARIKHRPYHDVDLLQALFLMIVGQRWGQQFRAAMVWSNLRNGKEPYFPEEPETSITCHIQRDRIVKQEIRFLPMIDSPLSHSYGPDALVEALQTVEQEIRFARACWPEKPLFVLQVDIREFYSTIPHNVVLKILEKMAVPLGWRNFFARFMRSRVRWRGQTRTVERGLVLDQMLTDLFAECLMFVLDLHIHKLSGLHTIRVVDDIWIVGQDGDGIARAFAGIQEFCRACGLELNEKKCGSLCLGPPTALPPGLPAGPPRWGLLHLQSDESWHINEPALAEVEKTLRNEIREQRSTLGVVTTYNEYFEYIYRQLGLAFALKGNHLKRMNQRLMRLHEELFGPGHGIAEELRRRLSSLFADTRLKERGLPHALLYWSATAGGLALTHPQLKLAMLIPSDLESDPLLPVTEEQIVEILRSRSTRQTLTHFSVAQIQMLLKKGSGQALAQRDLDRFFPDLITEETARDTAELREKILAEQWGNFYRYCVRRIEEKAPPMMPGMEQLVTDFIRRGSEVSGRQQDRLSPYWRWVIYSWGPSLLEALGTFRFLLTELVPLGLIMESRNQAGQIEEPEEPSQPGESGNEDTIPF